ncbi:SDR family oxidoreductase [Hydrogenophaga sp. 5NK40-0174]|uniref:SDR family NAD(P)-dependent oxidoreductase n=1 Tax=Hydrogenophaga sp. 5NK40-0174 TaxID=3127649 RepID=UPI00333F6D90
MTETPNAAPATSPAAAPASTKPRSLALVTGASSGIGHDLAEVLAREGYDLVITARRADALASNAAEWEARYRTRVHVVAVDLQQPDGPQQLFDQVQAAGLRPRILVNNAGVGVFGTFKDTPMGPDLGLMQLNMTSLVAVTKLFLPGVLAQRGRILNVASTAAYQPGPGMALYFASKAFVLHFSEALHAELDRDGVSVTTLCPGPTTTGFKGAAGMDKSGLFRTPWVATPMKVAEAGYRAMIEGKRECIPGLMNWMLAKGGAFMPRAMVIRLADVMMRES